MKKNIVFITTDHQRADTIGMIQCDQEVTPNLNKLAQEGINFLNTYTTCPLCVPARTSLATGQFPTKTEVVINDLKNIPEKTRDLKTLHEYLYENSYDISHFGMQHITLIPSLEKRVSFKEFISDDDYEKVCLENNLPIFGTEEDRVKVKELHGNIIEERNYTGSRVSYFEKEEKLFRDRFYLDNVLNYLKKEDFKNPVALFVNIWAPHPPLTVLKEYMDKFPNPILPENLNKKANGEPLNRREGIAAQLAEDKDENHWKEVWSAYLGLTNYADKLIGEIINKFKEKNEYDNTIFVFTADHGDHLGQHKMFQKMEMYDQAIKVPFILKVPNLKNKTIEFNTSHLDILPTVLDLLDINLTRKVSGESLLKYFDKSKDRYVYSQYSGNQVAVGDIRRSVVGDGFKYIFDPRDKEELFSLEDDPLEMNNLAQDKNYFEKKEQLKEQLKNFLNKENDWIKI
ncbi:sulfatase-like hydrolase/transferase [uncultured Cetobacterium sp.]|uniref:sulfatase-like hydrolase/transferase n=1 Tax=uncultured Cetobacterium sp. TaxID=527638 RepID=UPI00261B296A|nr:sulfatase-like hydrolase/transferase [uncultured Cetobacterium sp.]